MKAVLSLLGYLCIGYFLVKWTYKIGAGLDYWGPFVMVMIGLVCGLIYGVAKMVGKKRSEK